MTREQLERRRMAAAKDLQKGMKKAHVARKYGVTKTSVSRWAKTLEEGGPKALRARKTPGPKPRLSAHQKKRVVKMLLEGAEAHGWSTDLWTTKRVATLIEREFGISYHFNHCGQAA